MFLIGDWLVKDPSAGSTSRRATCGSPGPWAGPSIPLAIWASGRCRPQSPDRGAATLRTPSCERTRPGKDTEQEGRRRRCRWRPVSRRTDDAEKLRCWPRKHPDSVRERTLLSTLFVSRILTFLTRNEAVLACPRLLTPVTIALPRRRRTVSVGTCECGIGRLRRRRR